MIDALSVLGHEGKWVPKTFSIDVLLPDDVGPWELVKLSEQTDTNIANVRSAHALVRTIDGDIKTKIERTGQQPLKDALEEVGSGDELLSAEVTSEVEDQRGELLFHTRWFRSPERDNGDDVSESYITVEGTSLLAVEGAANCLKKLLVKRYKNGLVEPARPFWQRLWQRLVTNKVIIGTSSTVLASVVVYFLGIQ